MALAKLRQDYSPTESAGPKLTTELEGFAPTPSPALVLQQRLVQNAAAATAPNVEKWSPRKSLAMIVSVSAALWMAILMAGTEATKLIA